MQNINQIIESLKESLNGGNGIPFMEGRTQGQIVKDSIVKIKDFGFITKENEFAVFIVDGNDSEMFFGGQVLTEGLKTLETSVTKEVLSQLLSNGIPVKFGEAMSKAKRKYVTVEFFPEV